jgi:hypothetical protein
MTARLAAAHTAAAAIAIMFAELPLRSGLVIFDVAQELGLNPGCRCAPSGL